MTHKLFPLASTILIMTSCAEPPQPTPVAPTAAEMNDASRLGAQATFGLPADETPVTRESSRVASVDAGHTRLSGCQGARTGALQSSVVVLQDKGEPDPRHPGLGDTVLRRRLKTPAPGRASAAFP